MHVYVSSRLDIGQPWLSKVSLLRKLILLDLSVVFDTTDCEIWLRATYRAPHNGGFVPSAKSPPEENFCSCHQVQRTLSTFNVYITCGSHPNVWSVTFNSISLWHLILECRFISCTMDWIKIKILKPNTD